MSSVITGNSITGEHLYENSVALKGAKGRSGAGELGVLRGLVILRSRRLKGLVARGCKELRGLWASRLGGLRG